ncbi:MAG: DUF89 family protein [Sphingobacteriia bacterium]|nr:DUF89 family protein [Sphingobacteriia bacterium]
MHTNLDCYPCFLRQALSAARRAGAAPELQREILLETLEQLRALPPEATPPMMADDIHRLARTRTANPDPYREAKAEATGEALALLPVLRNDATREDAFAAGIDRIAEIIDNGAQAPGKVLEQCTESFPERFAEAELIIAKGQANYETLSTVSAPAFFLLLAECAIIAADPGIAPGALVVKGPTAS